MKNLTMQIIMIMTTTITAAVVFCELKYKNIFKLHLVTFDTNTISRLYYWK